MKKLLLSLFTLCVIASSIHAQAYLNWQRFTDGSAHANDSAVALEVDGNNIMVGGNVFNTGTLNDIEIKNYDLDGNLLWTGGYASPLNDHLAEFSCDASIPAIYGVGNSDNGSYLIGLLIKMDMNGNLLWSKNYSGSYPGNTKFLDVKVAPNGNIIVVGECMLSLFLCDASTGSKQKWSHILIKE